MSVAAVVIPAHDEGPVLRRCVDALLADAGPLEFEVWVAVNGSSDDTAAVARAALDGRARGGVVELPEPSKTAALRAGDARCSAYPRVYLDADVVLSTAAARALVQVLTAAPGAAAAAPRLRVDTAHCDRIVRGYYRVWSALPSIREGAVGSGVYAVNRAGHDRLGPFPDVLNDDGWVRRSFPASQRLVADADFEVAAARTARALIARRARIAVGNAELDRLGVVAASGPGGGSDPSGRGDLPGPGERSAGPAAVRAAVTSGAASPLDAACFVAVTVAARVIARWRRSTGQSRRWSTDRTTRVVASHRPTP